MLNAKQAYYFVYGVFALKVSTFLFVLNLVYYVTILSLCRVTLVLVELMLML